MADSPFLAKFRKDAGDTTDDQVANTVINFGRNIATLRGSNRASSKLARPLVNGRHSVSDQVLNAYAAAGKDVDASLRKRLDELDNLAANSQIASEMDDKVRLQLIGQGSKSLDSGVMLQHETRLVKEIGDLTRSVMTEGLSLDREIKRANLAAKKQGLQSNAVLLENQERERAYTDKVENLTLPELEEYFDSGNYREDNIPTTWLLNNLGQRRIQAVELTKAKNSVLSSKLNLDSNITNSSNADLQATSLAGYVLAAGDPDALDNVLARINEENKERLDNGEPIQLSQTIPELGFGEIAFGTNVIAVANQKLKDQFAAAEDRENRNNKTTKTGKSEAEKKAEQLKDLQNRANIAQGFKDQAEALVLGLSTADRAFLGDNGITAQIKSLASRVDTMQVAAKDIDSFDTDVNSAIDELRVIQKNAIELLPEGSRKAFEEIMTYGVVSTKASGVKHLEAAENINDIAANLTTQPLREVHSVLSVLAEKEAANPTTRGPQADLRGTTDQSTSLTRVLNSPDNRRQLGQALTASMTDKAIGLGVKFIKQIALRDHPVEADADGILNPQAIKNMAIHEAVDEFLGDLLTSENHLRGDKFPNLINYEGKFQTLDKDGDLEEFTDINGDAVGIRQINVRDAFEVMNLQSSRLKELGFNVNIMAEIFNNSDVISAAVADSLTPKNITEQSLITVIMPEFKGTGAIDNWANQIQQTTKASLIELENEYYRTAETDVIAANDELLANAVRAGVTESKVYMDALAEYNRDNYTKFQEALLDRGITGPNLHSQLGRQDIEELSEEFNLNEAGYLLEIGPQELLRARKTDNTPYITSEELFKGSINKLGGAE